MVSAYVSVRAPSLNERHLGYAVLIHLIFFMYLALGYIMFRRPLRKHKNNKKNGVIIKIRRRFFVASYILLLVGVASSIYAATYKIGLSAYLFGLMSGAINLRTDFMLTSAEGGISGVIKIQTYLPLAVFIAANVVRYFYDTKSPQREGVNRLIYWSLLAIFGKILFSQDRLTIAAVGAVFACYYLRKLTFRSALLIVSAYFIASYISGLRLRNYGLADFLFLYGKLGMVNLGISLGHRLEPSYGLQTIFHPLVFVIRYLGVNLNAGQYIKNWAWNPAQNLFGFSYIDFGYLSVIFLFIVGAIIGWIENLAKSGSFGARIVYFNILYCIISFVGVPAFRGLEFWYAMFVQFLLLTLGVTMGYATDWGSGAFAAAGHGTHKDAQSREAGRTRDVAVCERVSLSADGKRP